MAQAPPLPLIFHGNTPGAYRGGQRSVEFSKACDLG
jgi:hypothetical protein